MAYRLMSVEVRAYVKPEDSREPFVFSERRVLVRDQNTIEEFSKELLGFLKENGAKVVEFEPNGFLRLDIGNLTLDCMIEGEFSPFSIQDAELKALSFLTEGASF